MFAHYSYFNWVTSADATFRHRLEFDILYHCITLYHICLDSDKRGASRCWCWYLCIVLRAPTFNIQQLSVFLFVSLSFSFFVNKKIQNSPTDGWIDGWRWYFVSFIFLAHLLQFSICNFASLWMQMKNAQKANVIRVCNCNECRVRLIRIKSNAQRR